MNVIPNTFLLRLGGLIAALALLSCAPADEPTKPASHVIAFTTASGLRVEMLPQAGSGLVAANVFVGAGSTREAERNAGSSHFLEHLLFNGTTSRSQEELYAEVDRIGAYNNATTKQEYTHYMMVAPSEKMRQAMDIQADMLLHSTLPPDKFEKERGIVVEELRKDQDRVSYRQQRAIAEATYAEGNPYRRAVLGSVGTIESLDRDEVLAYYRSQYVPSNMRLLLMGDFDPTEARTSIEELFAAEAGRPAPPPRQVPIEAGSLRTRGFEDESLTTILRLPAPPADSKDLAAFQILADVLAGGESSRAYIALDAAGLRPRELSAGVDHQEGASTLRIQARFDPGTDIVAVRRVLLRAVATLGAHGIRASEWAPARTSLLADSIRHLAQLHYYAIYEGDRIWHAGAASEERFQTDLENSYERLSFVARKWFTEAVVDLIAVGPELKTEQQHFDPVDAGWVADELHGESSPLPGAGKIQDTRPLADSFEEATVTILDNGMTVIHRAIPETRMFAMHLWVRNRSAREPSDHEGMADLLHRTLPLGAGAYGRSEFDSLLRGIGANLKVTDSDWIPYDDYYTSPSFSFVRLDCVDIYWKEAIRSLALMLQEPRLEDEAIDEKRAEIQRRRAADADASSHRADVALRRQLLGHHPLTHEVFGQPGSLASVDSRQLQGFALDYLDPGELVLAVVGNLDRDAVIAQLETAFSQSRSAGQKLEEAPPWPLTKESRDLTLDIGGQQSTLRAARVFRIAPDDRWALLAATRILSNRMQQEIREVRGLAYSLGMSVKFQGDRAWIDARVSTQPKNLEEVRSLVAEFLSGSGPSFEKDELDVAVQGYLGRMRMRRVTALGQAYALCRDYVFENDLDFARREAEGLDSLGVPDVTRVRESYFGGERPTVWLVAR